MVSNNNNNKKISSYDVRMLYHLEGNWYVQIVIDFVGAFETENKSCHSSSDTRGDKCVCFKTLTYPYPGKKITLVLNFDALCLDLVICDSRYE